MGSVREPLKRVPLRFEALKTFGATALGGVMLIAGWSIFSHNGYDSALVFFLGLILLPAGLYALTGAVTGEFGESPWRIVASYREHLKGKRENGQT